MDNFFFLEKLSLNTSDEEISYMQITIKSIHQIRSKYIGGGSKSCSCPYRKPHTLNHFVSKFRFSKECWFACELLYVGLVWKLVVLSPVEIYSVLTELKHTQLNFINISKPLKRKLVKLLQTKSQDHKLHRDLKVSQASVNLCKKNKTANKWRRTVYGAIFQAGVNLCKTENMFCKKKWQTSEGVHFVVQFLRQV